MTVFSMICYDSNMNGITSTRIYNKLARLEQELRRLKAEAYRLLPRKPRGAPRYSEKAIQEAVRKTSDAIWRERYAKNAVVVS